jgi:histidyl-tRNA synthetase
MLGGQPTPAFGFGLGLERITLELQKQAKLPELEKKHVMLICVSDAQKPDLFRLQQKLLAAGVGVVADYSSRNLSAQLTKANKAGIGHAAILGEAEAAKQVVSLRDLATGEQTEVGYDDLAAHLG